MEFMEAKYVEVCGKDLCDIKNYINCIIRKCKCTLYWNYYSCLVSQFSQTLTLQNECECSTLLRALAHLSMCRIIPEKLSRAETYASLRNSDFNIRFTAPIFCRS